MIQYPLEFKTHTKADGGMAGCWHSESSGFKSAVAVPPEFQGPGGGLSPEDLYNQALTNCFVATFKVYCEHSKVTFERLEVESKLIVDLNEEKKPVMKTFNLKAKIFNPSNESRVRMLAERAAKSGFILNSVKTECQFQFEIA